MIIGLRDLVLGRHLFPGTDVDSGAAESSTSLILQDSLLALPFPIPLSNMICASPAALLALALLEEDGLIALLGWLGVLTMIAFHVGLLLLGAEGTRALWRAAFP